MTRTAAQNLVGTLAHHGVDRAFCVPGESYLAVLDALYDHPEILTVCCRHESGAGFMAVADAKITGRPGAVFVSCGPGAGNAAIAVYAAREDAVPLVPAEQTRWHRTPPFPPMRRGRTIQDRPRQPLAMESC